MSTLKAKGKSVPITINQDTQTQIKLFKDRLLEMMEYDEIREVDKLSINVILNELDPYNQNILIAFYGLADGSASALARVFNVNPHVISKRIKKITAYVHNRVTMFTDDNSLHN